MKFKITIIIIISVAVSYLLTLFLPFISVNMVSNLSIPIVGVLAGLLIGSIGVFLGSLSSIFTLIQLKNLNPEESKSIKIFLGNIENTVNELKHDVCFVVISLIISFIISFLLVGDIPGFTWPTQLYHFNKHIVLNTIILSLTLLSFYAILDCIKAMFILHKHYDTIIKNKLGIK